MSNIYTGNQYPKSSFVFDKIYNNFTEARDSVDNDGILLGRYILIKYCDDTLPQDRRLSLQSGDEPKNEQEKLYKENYNIDQAPNDRKVYRKAYNGEGFYYQEITCLHTNLTAENISNMQTLTWHIYN